MRDDVKEYIAAIGAIAELNRAFYESHLKQGFTEKEALALTLKYMETFIPKPGDSIGG